MFFTFQTAKDKVGKGRSGANRKKGKEMYVVEFLGYTLFFFFFGWIVARFFYRWRARRKEDNFLTALDSLMKDRRRFNPLLPRIITRSGKGNDDAWDDYRLIHHFVIFALMTCMFPSGEIKAMLARWIEQFETIEQKRVLRVEVLRDLDDERFEADRPALRRRVTS